MKRKAVLALMQTRFYAWLLLHVIPYIRFTTYYTSLRGWKYQRGYKLLQPGDILLTLDRKKLTTLLIPGEFSHAAVCVDKGSEWEISEMTHTDYTKSCFFDICKEADRVVILRCKDFDSEYRENFIAACKSFDNARYDLRFDMALQQKGFSCAVLACSELPYQSDFEHRCRVDSTDTVGLGMPYVSPNDWWEATKINSPNMFVAWDSDKEVNSE